MRVFVAIEGKPGELPVVFSGAKVSDLVGRLLGLGAITKRMGKILVRRGKDLLQDGDLLVEGDHLSVGFSR